MLFSLAVFSQNVDKKVVNQTGDLFCEDLVEFPTEYVDVPVTINVEEISYLQPRFELQAVVVQTQSGGCIEEYIDDNGKICKRPLPIIYDTVGFQAVILGYDEIVLSPAQTISYTSREASYCGFVEIVAADCAEDEVVGDALKIKKR